MADKGPILDLELITALAKGDSKTMEIFLDKGSDVNSVVTDGNTLLAAAAYYGHIDIVRLLLSRGADVNRKNNYGQTALDGAKLRKHHEIIELLEKHGAN